MFIFSVSWILKWNGKFVQKGLNSQNNILFNDIFDDSKNNILFSDIFDDSQNDILFNDIFDDPPLDKENETLSKSSCDINMFLHRDTQHNWCLILDFSKMSPPTSSEMTQNCVVQPFSRKLS